MALNTSAKVDDVSLVAKLGKATIGRSSDLSLAQGQVFETIKLSKSGKSKLAQEEQGQGQGHRRNPIRLARHREGQAQVALSTARRTRSATSRI